MNIEDLKRRKKELGYTSRMIAEKSGVPLSTVQKLFSGETKIPRYETLAKIREVLFPSGAVLREEALIYNYGKSTTLDDYYKKSDDIRVEIIDGTTYYMSAPSIRHQLIIGALYKEFLRCEEIMKEKGCTLLLSPVDVRLDRDNKTIVQPDLLIVCGELDDPFRIDGAPEYVAEVVSPSTAAKDATVKLRKYMNAGVREYWIIDYDNDLVTVYDLAVGKNGKLYNFDDEIPVMISDGKCSIDMGKIKKDINRQ